MDLQNLAVSISTICISKITKPPKCMPNRIRNMPDVWIEPWSSLINVEPLVWRDLSGSLGWNNSKHDFTFASRGAWYSHWSHPQFVEYGQDGRIHRYISFIIQLDETLSMGCNGWGRASFSPSTRTSFLIPEAEIDVGFVVNVNEAFVAVGWKDLRFFNHGQM